MKKRIISLLAACVLTVSFAVGCAKNKTETTKQTTKSQSLLPESVKSTGKKLVENGTTEYSIIVPSSADDLTMTAAQELKNFIQQSSGAEMQIVKDDGVGFDPERKVVSIGDTSFLSGSGVKVTSDVGNSGYVMKRIGNAIVIGANNGNGSCGAVYDMLHYLIGFETYASDELYFESKSDIDLLDFDIKFIPTIDMRSILLKSLGADTTFARRMGMYQVPGLGIWVTFGHTVISNYLPTEKYGSHTDWYNGAKNQVCYSNEEMRLEMVEVIKSRIVSNPDGRFVMIGHEDNFAMCECTKCIAARELMGGYGGQELDFTNKVAKDVSAWLQDNYPEREIEFLFFAYQTSSEPPAKLNEKTGKYEPVWKDFGVRKDVSVFYCPIESDFSKPFTDPINSPQYNQLKGWYDIFASKGCEKNIKIWTYSLAANSYMAPQYEFGTYGDHYKTFESWGVSYVLDQSVYDTALPGLEELKVYGQAKLMRRGDLNYDDIAEDFISHYYGLAANSMSKYHNFFRSYYKYLEETQSFNGKITMVTDQPEFWPIDVIRYMMNLLEEAITDLEPLRATDLERYETLVSRIRKEQVSPIYLAFKNDMNALSSEQKKEWWNILSVYTKKFDIVATRESYVDMAALVERWRGEIFGRGE